MHVSPCAGLEDDEDPDYGLACTNTCETKGEEICAIILNKGRGTISLTCHNNLTQRPHQPNLAPRHEAVNLVKKPVNDAAPEP